MERKTLQNQLRVCLKINALNTIEYACSCLSIYQFGEYLFLLSFLINDVGALVWIMIYLNQIMDK